MPRLFLALAIPSDVTQQLTTLSDSLQRMALVDAVHWVPPENFHITLVFLGTVDRDAIAGLIEAISTATAPVIGRDPGTLLFDLLFDGVSRFSDASSSILGCTITPSESLRAFQASLAQLCSPWCERSDSRAYVPHVTLGRLKTLDKEDVIDNATLTDANLSSGVITSSSYSRFGLYESCQLFHGEGDSVSSNPGYKLLAEFPSLIT